MSMDRLIFEKLCPSCADKLRSIKFAAEEQPAGVDSFCICKLCGARGSFSTYKVYKRHSEREE